MSADRQTFSRRLRFGKWAGAALGLIAAVAFHQIATNVVYARCPAQSAAFVLTLGAIWGPVALGGAILSWRTREALPDASTASAVLRTDRFIATLCAAFAFVCLLFIVFGATAGVILRCERS